MFVHKLSHYSDHKMAKNTPNLLQGTYSDGAVIALVSYTSITDSIYGKLYYIGIKIIHEAQAFGI